MYRRVIEGSTVFDGDRYRSANGQTDDTVATCGPAVATPGTVVVLQGIGQCTRTDDASPEVVTGTGVRTPSTGTPVRPVSTVSPGAVGVPPRVAASETRDEPAAGEGECQPAAYTIHRAKVDPHVTLYPTSSSSTTNPGTLVCTVASTEPPDPPVEPLTAYSSA